MFKNALVAEQNKQYAAEVKGMISEIANNIVCCYDGREAILLYEKLKPDIILIETILPNYDGFEIMEKIYNDDIIKIMLTSINKDFLIKKAFDLKADYIFVKPYAKNVFVKRIVQAWEFKNSGFNGTLNAEEYINENITKILKQLGIPLKFKGYTYIKDALCIMYTNSNKSVTIKEVYLEIAKKHNTTYLSVERNIRHAIETAMERGNITFIEEFFGYTISAAKGKPTNGEFLAALADRIL